MKQTSRQSMKGIRTSMPCDIGQRSKLRRIVGSPVRWKSRWRRALTGPSASMARSSSGSSPRPAPKAPASAGRAEVENRQAAVAQPQRAVHVHALPVRPAVSQGARHSAAHPAVSRTPVKIQEAGDSAHLSTSFLYHAPLRRRPGGAAPPPRAAVRPPR